MDASPQYRRALAAVVVAAVLLSSGCLTVGPTVTADTGGSPAFDSLSSTESWSGGQVRTSVTLAPNATTDQGVSKLVIVSEGGTSYYTTTLDSGETAATIYLPANQEVTLLAVNTVNGSVVDSITVRTDGDKLL